MYRPQSKPASPFGESEPAGLEPLDTSALVNSIRDLEAKLKAVTQREQEYRESMAQLEEEVRAAGVLQRSLLPVEPPAMRGGHVHVLYRPCSEVSGDVYDVFRIDDTRVGFAVADATGHGMPAALLSTLIRRTLRDVSVAREEHGGPNSARVLEGVSDELLSLGLDDCQFVAGLFGVFNEQTGLIRLARGGTPYPVVLSGDDQAQIRVVESDGPILGAIPEPSFEVAEFVLSAGERLIVSTDGVEPLIDAGANAESVEAAWTKFLLGCHKEQSGTGHAVSTDAILEHLGREITEHHAGHDDVTVLVIERVE